MAFAPTKLELPNFVKNAYASIARFAGRLPRFSAPAPVRSAYQFVVDRLRPMRAVMATTSFKMAASIAGVFAVFALFLLAGVYAVTAGRLSLQADQAAREELSALTEIWQTQGLAGLNRTVIERSASATVSLYVVVTPDGQVMSGNLNDVPVDLSKIERPDHGESLSVSDAVGTGFVYARPDAETGRIVDRHARGVFLAGPDGFGLFVARDLGPGFAIADQIARVIWLSSLAVIAFALLGGFITARQAVSRVEKLSEVTRAVMAGDLTRRAPLRAIKTGTGDEFDKLGTDLNAMLERTERLVHSARSIGDAIAHDLRSPLTRLRARLEYGQTEAATTEELHQLIDGATQELDDVVATFNAVLRLSRLEAGEGGRLKDHDLSALVLDVADLYEPSFSDIDVALITDIAPNIHARVDAPLMMQALTNCLDNALKYAPVGTVTLSLQQEADQSIYIAVADSGTGIEEKDYEKALARFQRLDEARSVQGSGLGLALVAAIAEAHGAAIKLSKTHPEKSHPEKSHREISNDENPTNENPGLTVTLILPPRLTIGPISETPA